MSLRRGIGKVRQLEVFQLWLQDKVARGEIEVYATVNLADALTKFVGKPTMDFHMNGVKQSVEAGRHQIMLEV